MWNYDDIINKSRPEHKDDAFAAKHPQMPVSDRAKIFSPFATLKSHAPTVKKRERLTMPRIELSPEDAAVISDSLTELMERVRIGENTEAEITYFVPDKERKGEGAYVTVSGKVKKFNVDMGFLKIGDTNIFFKDIYSVKI